MKFPVLTEVLVYGACAGVFVIVWLLARIKDELINRLSRMEYEIGLLRQEMDRVRTAADSTSDTLVGMNKSLRQIESVAEDHRLPVRSTLDD